MCVVTQQHHVALNNETSSFLFFHSKSSNQNQKFFTRNSIIDFCEKQNYKKLFPRNTNSSFKQKHKILNFSCSNYKTLENLIKTNINNRIK